MGESNPESPLARRVSNGEQAAFLDHWDGVSWQAVDLPLLDRFVSLGGLTLVASDDVWLAGSIRTADGSVVPEMLHWDGTRGRSS